MIMNGQAPAIKPPREFAMDVTQTLRVMVIDSGPKPVFFIEEKNGIGWEVIRRIDGPHAYREMGMELAKLSTENVGRIKLSHGAHALPSICRHYPKGHGARIS